MSYLDVDFKVEFSKASRVHALIHDPSNIHETDNKFIPKILKHYSEKNSFNRGINNSILCYEYSIASFVEINRHNFESHHIQVIFFDKERFCSAVRRQAVDFVIFVLKDNKLNKIFGFNHRPAYERDYGRSDLPNGWTPEFPILGSPEDCCEKLTEYLSIIEISEL